MRILAPLLLSTCLAASAYAQDDDDDDDSVTGSRLPALGEVKDQPTLQDIMAAFEAEHPYGIQAYWGNQQLGMPDEQVHDIRSGLEKIYERDYKGARNHFDALDGKWPDLKLSNVMDSMIWQALMLENFDYRYESQWEVSTKKAKADLGAALDKPGNQGIENFLMGGIVGIEAIHTMRREKYLPALSMAFDAMDYIEKARVASPDFTDLLLADGIYNYWRTAVTMSSSALPDFGDHRVEGIEQMQKVENEAVFLGAPATLALIFTWLEEKDKNRALKSALKNKRAYPDNVINNLVLGQTYISKREFELALKTFDEILAVAPNNDRVHYYKGVALLRSGQADDAKAEFERYLEAEHLEDWQKGAAHYRLGQVYNRQKEFGKAMEEFKLAVKDANHKGAKRAIDRLKKRKKEGKIDY